MRWLRVAVWLLLAVSSGPALSESRPQLSYTTYGTPGLIDMPTAESAPDAELGFTSSYFAGSLRNTATFQILPRLSGSFRYSIINDFGGPGRGTLYDRSFDVRFRFIDEGAYRPSIAVGLQDIIGTGIYSGEYFVATKHLSPRFTVTGGLGWGRLGSHNGFSNPLGIFDPGFRTRPAARLGPQGGLLEYARWFRGDAAFFGGVAWQPTDRLSLKLEYSSDAYRREVGTSRLFARNVPVNLGVSYRLRPGVELGAHYLYGSEFGLRLTMLTNPKRPPFPKAVNNAPRPVTPRPPGLQEELGWFTVPEREPVVRRQLIRRLSEDGGLVLEGLELDRQEARVWVRNTRYAASAQAVGRTARILTGVLPASVERFRIIPVENGIPLSEVAILRSDIESLENAHDAAWQAYMASAIRDGAIASGPRAMATELYPEFSWGLAPYVQESLFDPDNPVRGDIGLELSGRFAPRPGTIFQGRVRQKLVGNLADITRASNSVIERVRTETYLYQRNDWPTIPEFTVNQYFRPGREVFGRVTAGLLESQYGGVSAELLWKPVDSRFALGAELNWVKQRGFNQLFGFRSYDVVTGHVSGYWDMPNGFHGQIDVGRYLAGDWGATFSLDREFRNGWKVGAFATFTTVPFSDFGEGSFDKGIRLTIPLSTLSGQETRASFNRTIRPVLRDGGARVSVAGRLYQTVRGSQEPALRDEWGLFWQ